MMCGACGKEGHRTCDCEHYEDAKAITIARLRAMPSNLRLSILEQMENNVK